MCLSFFSDPLVVEYKALLVQLPLSGKEMLHLGLYTHRVSSLGQIHGFRPLPPFLLLVADLASLREVPCLLSEVPNQSSIALASGISWKVHLLKSEIQSVQ